MNPIHSFCSFKRAAVLASAMFSMPVWATDHSDIEKLRQEFEARIKALEAQQAAPVTSTSNSFNPAFSLILDGGFNSLRNDPEEYVLPGFALSEEAAHLNDGLSIGHSELMASANIDQHFRGQFTLAFAEHDGETETEIEEAFVETLGIGKGLTVRGGRFFSSVGYLNQQHEHARDFADAPLVYRGIWGNRYLDDGVRIHWVAPVSEMLVELGAEAFSGGKFPGGESASGVGSHVLYANLGGDVGSNHSWQLGASHYAADVGAREFMPDPAVADEPVFAGNSDVNGINLVYKWAPDGNYRDRHFKLQGEYFRRDESGRVDMQISGDATTYRGEQEGYYLQGVYQFHPQWRAGLRYDWLDSDNRGVDLAGVGVLAAAGLTDAADQPQRHSVMLEWNPSEFSRLRLQFNRDESGADTDNQVFLRYTMSLGAHGAHAF